MASGLLNRLLCLIAALNDIGRDASRAEQAEVRRDVGYVPTPQPVVDAMLKAAKVAGSDVVYDLGSGDGRIAVTAAKVYGARAVGIDIDPQRIKEANANAKSRGGHRQSEVPESGFVHIEHQRSHGRDAVSAPVAEHEAPAEVEQGAQAGTRIVSHHFEMKDVDGYEFQPEQKLSQNGSTIYLWTIPIARK